MKKFLTVVGIIFAVSVIAFGVSVAATGIKSENSMGFSIGGANFISGGENQVKTGEIFNSSFTAAESEEVTDLEIGTVSAATEIFYDDNVSEIQVKFETNRPGTIFSAKIENGRLVINEGSYGFLSWFGSWSPNRLEVRLPKEEYKEMKLNTTSGNVKIGSLIFDDFNSTATSGTSEYNIFADDLRIFTTSGKTTVTNCTVRKASSLNFNTTSGTHTISGFTADEYHLRATSGKITVNGLSGKGDIQLTSGKIEVNYAEWNDKLYANVTSGTCVINLPENSNVSAKVDALSGGMTINKDGTRISLSKNDSISPDGENCHEIKADMTSGSVKVNIG